MDKSSEFSIPKKLETSLHEALPSELRDGYELQFKGLSNLPSTEEAKLTNEALARARSSSASAEQLSTAENDIQVIIAASLMSAEMMQAHLKDQEAQSGSQDAYIDYLKAA